MGAAQGNSTLSQQQRDDLLKQILGQDYATSGENLPILSKVIGYISNTSDMASVAELIPVLNTALSNSRLFMIVSSSASILSILLFPVGAMINIIDAYQVGIKMYSFRALAYTITAWAYNQPIPSSSPTIIRNSRTRAPVSTEKQIEEKHRAWRRASDSVINELNKVCEANNMKPEDLKLLLRAMSDGDDKKLCDTLLRGYEGEFREFASRAVWISNYTVRYPY